MINRVTPMYVSGWEGYLWNAVFWLKNLQSWPPQASCTHCHTHTRLDHNPGSLAFKTLSNLASKCLYSPTSYSSSTHSLLSIKLVLGIGPESDQASRPNFQFTGNTEDGGTHWMEPWGCRGCHQPNPDHGQLYRSNGLGATEQLWGGKNDLGSSTEEL